MKPNKYIELNSIHEVDREHVAIPTPHKVFMSETKEASIEDEMRTTFMLSLCVRVYHSNLRREDSVRSEGVKNMNNLLYGSLRDDLISLKNLIQEDKDEAVSFVNEMIHQLP